MLLCGLVRGGAARAIFALGVGHDGGRKRTPCDAKQAKDDTNRIAALMRARVGSAASYGHRHPVSSGVVHKVLTAAPVPAKLSPS